MTNPQDISFVLHHRRRASVRSGTSCASITRIISIAFYTYALVLLVRKTTPPCSCGDEVARIEYRCENDCDPVRWSLWQSPETSMQAISREQEKDAFRAQPKEAKGTWTDIQNVTSISASENPQFEQRVKSLVFYANRRNGSNYPPDRILFTKFFASESDNYTLSQSRTEDAQSLERGVFIEIGAGDGLTNSKSLFFEKYLNWTGILIEASPPNIARYQSQAPNQRSAKFIASAACAEPGKKLMVGSGDSAGFVETMHPKHRQMFKSDWGTEWAREYNVSCVPLSAITVAESIGKVDLLSVDVEGAELEVLKGVNFQHLNIRVIVIDLPLPYGEMEKKARELLLQNNFCLGARVGPNEYWVSDAILKRLHCGWSSFQNPP